jgi:hypothetical protein
VKPLLNVTILDNDSSSQKSESNVSVISELLSLSICHNDLKVTAAMIMSFEDPSKLISELCVALYKMMRILILMAQEFLDAKRILERAAKAEGIESNLGYFSLEYKKFVSWWVDHYAPIGDVDRRSEELAKNGNLSTPDSPCPEYFFGVLESVSAEYKMGVSVNDLKSKMIIGDVDPFGYKVKCGSQQSNELVSVLIFIHVLVASLFH